MHRHGYKGRKFGRERDERKALIKSLASNFIEHKSMVTTLPKAKEMRPYIERLITKAKIGDLHNKRQIIAAVAHTDSAHKLVDEIAPLLTKRQSGYLRIVKLGHRKGDNAEQARLEFVDDLAGLRQGGQKPADKAEKPAEQKAASKPVTATKKTTQKAAKK